MGYHLNIFFNLIMFNDPDLMRFGLFDKVQISLFVQRKDRNMCQIYDSDQAFFAFDRQGTGFGTDVVVHEK